MFTVLLLQVATAVPPTPTRVIVRAGGETRTLSDVARERRASGTKPAGSFSAAAVTTKPESATSSAVLPTPDLRPDAILSVESADAPGVSGGGNVWISGTVANRGQVDACRVRVLMKVYYGTGGGQELASSRETIVEKVPAHGKAFFKSFVEAPPDLGMSEKQRNGNTVEYPIPMKKMGKVEAEVTSHERCRP